MAGLIVITRPRDEAEPLAAQLTARGYRTLVEPMLDVVPVAASVPPLADYSGLVFTSANGARIFSGLSNERLLPAYAVGGRTAAALRDSGFVDIREASGDAMALSSVIRGDHRQGALLHLSGLDVARDLGALLAPDLRVDRLVVYKAVAAVGISDTLSAVLYARQLIHVLFFSVRTVTTFGTLLQEHGFADMITASSALCLSNQIADVARQMKWGDVETASVPTADALLSLLPRAG